MLESSNQLHDALLEDPMQKRNTVWNVFIGSGPLYTLALRFLALHACYRLRSGPAAPP